MIRNVPVRRVANVDFTGVFFRVGVFLDVHHRRRLSAGRSTATRTIYYQLLLVLLSDALQGVPMEGPGRGTR